MELRNRFNVGEFVVLVELVPPKGVDISGMVKVAGKIGDKVTAFVVPDMAAAVMRMSALGAAMILQQKGFRAVMQVCCRDRNRLALQGDLLAAYAGGVTSLMAVSGEDLRYGDHHEATAVDDLDLIGLIETVGTLRGGKDLSGAELAGEPRFFCGTTVNVGLGDGDLAAEVAELNRRAAAGAEFFVTTPVFDPAAIEPFRQLVDIRRHRVVPTVMLLKSIGMARYIQRNMAHIRISDEIISRLQKAPDKTKESLRIARETIAALREADFKGVLISPMGWEENLPELFEHVD
jgi:methylenetetrahydrofolate reductase (NADPH)